LLKYIIEKGETMIKITFEFANVDEAIVALGKLAVTAGKPVTAAVVEVPAARPKGRPKKNAGGGGGNEAISSGAVGNGSAPVVTDTSQDGERPTNSMSTPTAPATVTPASYDDAQIALESLFNAKGITTALEVLKQFNGAARLRDLKPDEFAPFIDAAKKAQQ
jgi:hypothetical protein